MRCKKSYNIHNIEAHLNTYRPLEQHITSYKIFSNNVGRDLIFQTKK